MDYLEILKLMSSATIILSAAGYVIKKVIDYCVNKSIEDYKSKLAFNSKKREQAALVAELLSEWVKRPVDKSRLNRLTWEATLWLPEDEVQELHKLLSHHKKAPSTKQFLINVREVIQGDGTKLKASDVVNF
ncbi:TPA: hypothetical protein RQK93_004718 [Vibrio vulnificus]|nr:MULTISPECIES: hypothetical protein [Vibrio]EGQ7854982.1 hypothetical protein [Vibrio vulnificus]EGQ9832571.1 hypothetical protein [Vibrio vulnificus]EGQ9882800.1 hypothetical protein [Vibrio vulnificus]EGR1869021.1 hypothetical protein [Vibrio vulnificus]EGR7954333.1 hypothetical protein [Vibrio vulnificus]